MKNRYRSDEQFRDFLICKLWRYLDQVNKGRPKGNESGLREHQRLVDDLLMLAERVPNPTGRNELEIEKEVGRLLRICRSERMSQTPLSEIMLTIRSATLEAPSKAE
ncbi:MAG: hypothetical protein BGO01_03230 [Armatimonadetes bacterium 55-13]|nr:MAG: hypothetical protein BGO01_03230 [Armatimonadetes bacterium 55-13]